MSIGLLLVVFLAAMLSAKFVYKDIKCRRFLKAGKKVAAFPARKIPFSSITSTQLVFNTNEIMRSIFNKILNLKKQYPQLQLFDEKYYSRGYEIIYGKDCWGYCPPWQLAKISYGAFTKETGKGIFLDVYFTEFPYNEYTESVAPLAQIYIERLEHWLCVALRTNNPGLNNAIIEIVKDSVKDLETKEFIVFQERKNTGS